MKLVDGSFVANCPLNVLFKVTLLTLHSKIQNKINVIIKTKIFPGSRRAPQALESREAEGSFLRRNGRTREVSEGHKYYSALFYYYSVVLINNLRVERKYKNGTSIKKKALNIANLSTLILEQVSNFLPRN